MKLHDKGINYVTFDLFDNIKFIRHCFSTKIGGVSNDYFSSCNLGFNRGESNETVLENFKLLGNEVGFDYKNLVFSDQVHDNKIYTATKKDSGLGIIKENTIKNIDALVTNEKNLVLTTFYADCVPLFFVDIDKKVIALAHSGWKGTVLKIAVETIKKMQNDFASKSDNILVGIGPSICKNCFEVDFPVYEQFKMAFEYADDFILFNPQTKKYNIDMWGINKKMLLDAGILDNHIEVTNYCTKCNSDIFYSHRAMGTKRGSLAGFLELLEV